MKAQQGAVTIITTAILLMALLLLVLGSYRATFHQIKVAQNELKMRSNHWIAEGAIECLYTYVRANDEAPSNLVSGSSASTYTAMLATCISSPSSESLYTELDLAGNYRVVYELNGVELVSKTMEQVGGNGGNNFAYQWRRGSWSDL